MPWWTTSTSTERSAVRFPAGVAVLALVVCVQAVAQDLSPAEERKQLESYFRERFPKVALDDYVYGALIANPGGREQYDQIMEFPPFIGDIEQGRKLWETPFRNGKSFGDCFENGGRNVAGLYPYFDEVLGKVVTFENALNACLKTNGEQEMPYGSRSPMGVLEAYARTLSDGMRIDVKVDSPRALERYRSGRDLFYRRIGQLNASCAGCHVYNAGRVMRMEIISPMLGHAAHWPIFRGGEELMTFQGRFKRCMEQMRATPLGFNSPEWNDLEYYLAAISNGLPLKSSVFRK